MQINLRLERDQLDAIDGARLLTVSRSAWIREAIQEKLGGPQKAPESRGAVGVPKPSRKPVGGDSEPYVSPFVGKGAKASNLKEIL
jgi:hypothetical protein